MFRDHMRSEHYAQGSVWSSRLYNWNPNSYLFELIFYVIFGQMFMSDINWMTKLFYILFSALPEIRVYLNGVY